MNACEIDIYVESNDTYVTWDRILGGGTLTVLRKITQDILYTYATFLIKIANVLAHRRSQNSAVY